MTSAKLGEICTIVSGGTPSRSKSEYWINGTIPWIKIGNIKGKYVVNADENITELGLEKSSAKFLKKGTILYTIFATLGEVGILNIDACTNQAIAGITIKDTTIIGTDFLYYYLKSKKQYVDRIGRGVAQNNINMSILRNFDVPLLSLEKQKDIVSTLDTLQSIIAHRRTQLEKLDLLVKARFVEMFGTLESPASDFEYDTLKNLCIKITDGKHGGCTFEEGTAFYFVGAREIYNDSVHYETAPEISAEEFYKDYKRCNVEKGDFLIVNTGATIGKSAIAFDERTEHTLLQKSVALLKINREKLLPIFLMYCYKVNDSMYKVESASAQPNLLLSKINATRIYVPPLELQQLFADFVKQVDKSKATVQKALDEAQLLFDSLMQEYFG